MRGKSSTNVVPLPTSLATEIGNTIILSGRAKDATFGYGIALRFGFLRNITGTAPSAPTDGFYIGLLAGPMFDGF